MRKLVWETRVTPHITVALDDSLSVVLEVAEGVTRTTVSNAGAMIEAMNNASYYAYIANALVLDGWSLEDAIRSAAGPS